MRFLDFFQNLDHPTENRPIFSEKTQILANPGFLYISTRNGAFRDIADPKSIYHTGTMLRDTQQCVSRDLLGWILRFWSFFDFFRFFVTWTTPSKIGKGPEKHPKKLCFIWFFMKSTLKSDILTTSCTNFIYMTRKVYYN